MSLGIGVMLNLMSSNKETVEAITSSISKHIKHIELKEDKLKLTFEDGSQLTMWDDGQSCCEVRHMVTADRLEDFFESVLLGVEVKDAPNVNDTDGGYEHEVQFLDIKTSKGVIQMANHNEHNGYYGGFSIKASYRKV
jgi:hypothetical protein